MDKKRKRRNSSESTLAMSILHNYRVDIKRKRMSNKDNLPKIPDNKVLKRDISILMSLCGLNKGAEISILLTDDRGISYLNRKYLDREGPTDVLSFPLYEGEMNPIYSQCLGDIVISIDAVKKQSEELGHSPEEELYYLILHGILHLEGYDHEEGVPANEVRKMKNKEKRVWREFRKLKNWNE